MAKKIQPTDRYQGLKNGTIKPESLTEECIAAGTEWYPCNPSQEDEIKVGDRVYILEDSVAYTVDGRSGDLLWLVSKKGKRIDGITSSIVRKLV
jgi:hypothetical protein